MLQKFIKKKYDGFKADIFSLGVVLFTLVTGVNGFQYIKEKKDYDDFYDLIKLGKYPLYWETVEKILKMTFTNRFKNLYIKMVSPNPKERPSVKDILNGKIEECDWLKEIRDLKEKKDELAKLEESIRVEFEKREIIIEKKRKEIKKQKKQIIVIVEIIKVPLIKRSILA